jgi:hypothetical protein
VGGAQGIFVAVHPEEGRVIEQGTGERMIRLELKYCERCGGLLLRRTGGAVVYCQSCAKSLSELPVMRKVEKVTGGRKTPTLASQTWGTVKTVEACEKQVPRLPTPPCEERAWRGPRIRREDAATLGMTAGEAASKKEPQSVGAPSPKGIGCGTPVVVERTTGCGTTGAGERRLG